MLELTEETVKDFIKEGIIVLMGYGDKCGFCDKYAPTFTSAESKFTDYKFGKIKLALGQPSEFKRTYMKQEKSEVVVDSIPVTFVFENGAVKYRQFGIMSEEQLKKFITSGELPSPPDNKQQRLGQLYAMKGELVTSMEINQQKLQAVNSELEVLLGLRKG